MKKVLITMAALAASTSVMAGPSWTYVDAGVSFADSNYELGDDAIGYGIRGSFGFGSLWHIQANVASVEVNGGKGDPIGFDDTTYSLRGGIHPAVTDNTDFVLDIGYEGQEWDFDGLKVKPTSYDIRTGLRSNVGQLELRAFISIVQNDFDVDDAGFDGKGRTIEYSVGGQYNFSDAWSVGIDHVVGGGVDEVIPDVGDNARLRWGQNVTDVYVRWSF
jgi:hypothetical protein